MNLPPFHWFDGVAVVCFVAGAWRGWRNGFAWELPRVVMWFLVAGLGILVTNPAADFADRLGVTAASARLLAFGLLTLVIVWTFTALLRGAGEKLQQTGGAGKLEYRAGLVLGLLHHGLILLVLLGALATVPLRDSRFAEVREQILNRSFTGKSTRSYWRQLAPEYELPPSAPGSPPPQVVQSPPTASRGTQPWPA